MLWARGKFSPPILCVDWLHVWMLFTPVIIHELRELLDNQSNIGLRSLKGIIIVEHLGFIIDHHKCPMVPMLLMNRDQDLPGPFLSPCGALFKILFIARKSYKLGWGSPCIMQFIRLILFINACKREARKVSTFGGEGKIWMRHGC